MTKKKRGPPSVEELLARPWCYYCERDFDDLKVLLQHQKAKHFKCDRCGRRLNTAGGLSVHMTQVHKENLEFVENALPNRAGLNVEIFGMEGIPEDIVQQHNQRVITQYHQDAADRQAATGNPAPGSGDGGNAAKKPKLEAAGDLKARLAAFRAKKAAGETPGANSGNGTPVGAGQATQSPGASQSPAPFQDVSPFPPPQYQPQTSPPPPNPHQSYPQHGFPQPNPFGQTPPPFPHGPPGYLPPNHQYHPGMPQFPPFPHNVAPGFQPPPFGVGSPPPGIFNQQRPQAQSPASNGAYARPPGLTPAPGLPSRPSFAAPPVNAQQMQQMHHGQFAASQDPRSRPQDSAGTQELPLKAIATEADVDDLIANAAKDSAAAPKPASETVTEKKSKKEKEKAMKLVYEDNETGPEEKMAELSRYAFDPMKDESQSVLVSADGAMNQQVSGTVRGEDDVMDAQG